MAFEGKSLSQKQVKNNPLLGIIRKIGQTFSQKTRDRRQKTNKKLKLESKIENRKSIEKPPAIFRALSKILQIVFYPLINPYLRYSLVILLILSVGILLYLLKDLPSPHRLTGTENYAVSTQIFDRNGELLYEIFANEHRIPVEIEDLPPHLLEATIAIEDQRFYRHFGVDILGIIRAFNNNLRGRPIEGGSTITQQLVKNALLTKERSIQRKIKEALLAIITELIYNKQEILEMYLNYIPYGGTAVGIEAASEQYFDKSASELSLAEAALLAGLPQAPSVYSPFGSDPQRAANRRREVLRRMVEEDYLSPVEAEKAASETLDLALSKTDIRAPHFVFYVRDLLYEEYGVETVEKGGLRVTTTLDLELQETAQASLSAEIDSLERYKVGNGAAMIVKPNTGEILSMIGSRDYFDKEKEGEVNVTLALRQPGSSIKPIMYATAFQEKLLNPGSVLLDIPTCFKIPNQKDYCPKNYDGSFKGPVTVRRALANSLNIPAVRALKIIGLETFIDRAKKMGITTWTDYSNYGLSLTLGGGEVRMIDMAQTFSILANQGVKVPLNPILKITDYTGEVYEELDVESRKKDLEYLNNYESDGTQGELERVMDRAPAYLVSHIMQDNDARTEAFGPRSELVIPDQIVSAKTGTTNNLKDNWTVGFTPEFLTITWVGNNDGSPMNQYLVSGVTGAAPIFNDIMSFVLQGKEAIWQEKPSDVASATVCVTGMPQSLSGEDCQERDVELFWKESYPSNSKIINKEIWIHPETGLPYSAGEPQDGLQLQSRQVFTDPLTESYCVDCPRATNEEGKVIYEQHTVSNLKKEEN